MRMNRASTPKVYTPDRTSDPRLSRSVNALRRGAPQFQGAEVPEFSRRAVILPLKKIPELQPVSPRPRSFRNTWAFVLLLAVMVGVPISNQLLPEKSPDKLAMELTNSSNTAMIPLPEMPSRSRSKVVHRIQRGESLQRIFDRYGLATERLHPLFPLTSGAAKDIDLSTPLAPGSRVAITLDRHGALNALSFKPRLADGYLTFQERSGSLVPAFEVAPTLRADRVISGTVTASFGADAQRAGLPYESVDLLVDLFGDRIEFRRDFRKGDRFAILMGSEETANGSVPVVLAAAFDVGGKKHVAARYVGIDGKTRYFDDKGEQFGNTFLRYPLKFSRISSLFSDSRLHPVLKRRRPHLGVDFAAPVGTPVRSVADGKIVFSGYKGPNGNMVMIRHTDRLTTTYLHLSRISSGLRKGRTISKGETIGAVGCTGLCSGPHLHFGLFDRGKYVDPLHSKLPVADALGRGLAIDPIYLKNVLATLEHYLG